MSPPPYSHTSEYRFQMYSTLLLGAKTHKDVHSRAWLVRFYYKNRIFMGYCCTSCEVSLG
jgi:CDP-diacylglycerol--inositol 3-phosphatidyltransferase